MRKPFTFAPLAVGANAAALGALGASLQARETGIKARSMERKAAKLALGGFGAESRAALKSAQLLRAAACKAAKLARVAR